jgi:hypothetical protein
VLRPPLDFRSPLPWLAIGIPIFALAVAVSPAGTKILLGLAGFLAAMVAFVYGPLYVYCTRGPGSRALGRIVSGVTIAAVFAPLLLGGAFHGSLAPTMLTSAGVLALEAAVLETIRRRSDASPQGGRGVRT